MTRKEFVIHGLTAGVAAGGIAAGWFGVGLVEYMGASPDTPWKSLTPKEAEELDRLAEELIPADPPSPENGVRGVPGAHDAKVVRYIDWQLATGAPYERHLPTYRKHLALIREGGGQEGMSCTDCHKGHDMKADPSRGRCPHPQSASRRKRKEGRSMTSAAFVPMGR